MKFKLIEVVLSDNVIRFCFFKAPSKLKYSKFTNIENGFFLLDESQLLYVLIKISDRNAHNNHADMHMLINEKIAWDLLITDATADVHQDDIVRTNADQAIIKLMGKDQLSTTLAEQIKGALGRYYLTDEVEFIKAEDLGGDSFQYPVGKITDNNFFDTNYSEIGYIQHFLRNPVKDNKEFKIEYLSPQEYFQACAEIFNSTVDKQIRQIEDDEEILNQLYKAHQSGNQFPLTYINYADKTQEGRHRMYLIGELYGWDKKYPVGIIRWIDTDRAEREAEEARQEDIRHYVKNDIENLKQWSYDSFEEFESEVNDWKIPRWEKDYDFRAELIDKGLEYIIRIGGVDFVFDKNELKIRDQEPNYDDLDIEDLE